MQWIVANNPIRFPALGIDIDPPVGFTLGPLSVHFYGVIIAVGLMLAVIYGLKRSSRFGLKEDDILDGVLGIVPFAIICARAYYCIFSWEKEFAANPISVLYVWNGGLAIYGGVIGAAIGVIVFCKIKKIKLGAVMDIVALGFLIGQCIGRWGNFFNREAYGAVTDSFFAMEIYSDIDKVRDCYHPTFLYESAWNLAGFVVLHFLSKKRQYDGQIALGYVLWYGFGRTFIEGLRKDSLPLGDFRVSQLLAAASCVVALGVLVWQMFRTHEKEKLYVNMVAAKAAQEAQPEEMPAVEENTEEENTEE